MLTHMVPVLTPEEVRSVADEARREPVRAWKTAGLCGLALAAFAGSLVLAAQGWAWLVPAAPLLALSLTVLSVVVHDCAHGTLTGSRRADTVLGTIAGLLTWTPFLSYRRGHEAHHAWAGTDRDPTPNRTVAPNRALDLLLRAHVPVFYWTGVYGPYLVFDLRHRRIVSWAIQALAIVAVHAGFGAWLGWIYPALAAAGYVGWGVLYENLFTLVQHAGLAPVDKRERYAPREQVHFSRTVPLPLAGFFLHFNLHKEHHLFPDLNFQLLPRAGELLRARRPDVYAFTDETPGWRRRRLRAHEVLMPEVR